MRPEPALHSPAIARKKLVRPELGLPRISTRSPGPTSSCGGSSAMQPCRVSTRTASRVKRPCGSSPRSMQAGAGLDGVEVEQRLAEVHHAQQRRPPVGDGAGVVDEPAQRLLHLVEGAHDHHQLAEAQPPGEVAGRRHDDREDQRDPAVAGGDPGQAHPRHGNLPQHRDQGGEARLEPVAWSVGLAVAERDALGALRALHQREAELGLARVAARPRAAPAGGRPARRSASRTARRGAPPRPCSRGSRGRGRRSG